MNLRNLIDVSLNLLIAAQWVNLIGHSNTLRWISGLPRIGYFLGNSEYATHQNCPPQLQHYFTPCFSAWFRVVAIDSECITDISNWKRKEKKGRRVKANVPINKINFLTFTFYIYFAKLSNMSFHMSWKIFCPRGCIVTLVAFVWLFSAVHFKMRHQMACMSGWKVSLVAFICFFSTVCFQMFPQIACPRGCIATLIAFVWFFSTMSFQMCPQITCTRRGIVTLVAFV